MDRCRRCHRQLKTAESKLRGIGPVCESKSQQSQQLDLDFEAEVEVVEVEAQPEPDAIIEIEPEPFKVFRKLLRPEMTLLEQYREVKKVCGGN